MICNECGALLLDSDTYCGKCGAKVVKINKCPRCGEIIRAGMKYCSSCGYRYDDMPLDLIEETIIRDAARELDVAPMSSDVIKKHREERRPSDDYEIEYYEDESEEDYEDESEESDKYYEDEESDEYYEDEESDEYNDDIYDEDDDEYYEDSDDDDEDEDDSPSAFSRLITAGMIVAGLILVLLIAVVFFNNRKEKGNNNIQDEITEEVTNETELSEDNNSDQNDGIVGTLTIVDNVNVRDYPSKDNSNILMVARAGETYSYYGFADESNNWIHIKIDDERDGYVSSKYVELH